MTVLKNVKQKGLSPKLTIDLVVSVVAFVLLAAGIDLDETTSAALAKVLGFVAGIIVGPGSVVVPAGQMEAAVLGGRKN